MSQMITNAVAGLTETQRGWLNIAIVFLGSIFLALMARVSVPLPFTPVPVSMQTFAIFILAGTLGSQRAFYAVITYIVEGTCGLPVFAGGVANPVWFMGPKAGYVVGFLAAAFLIGKLLETTHRVNFVSLILILALGEAAILSLGSLWLGLFVGLEKAFVLGALPFLAGACMKIPAAAAFLQGVTLVKRVI